MRNLYTALQIFKAKRILGNPLRRHFKVKTPGESTWLNIVTRLLPMAKQQRTR